MGEARDRRPQNRASSALLASGRVTLECDWGRSWIPSPWAEVATGTSKVRRPGPQLPAFVCASSGLLWGKMSDASNNSGPAAELRQSRSERHGQEAPPTPQKMLGGNLLHLGRLLKPLCVSVSSLEKWGSMWPLGATWGWGRMKTAWIRDLDPPR